MLKARGLHSLLKLLAIVEARGLRSVLMSLPDLQIAHDHGVYVSTGGWMEYVLTKVGCCSADVKWCTYDASVCLFKQRMLALVEQMENAGLA